MDDAEPDIEPAAHAAGVGLGRPVGGRLELERVEHLGRAGLRVGLVHAVQPALDHELAAAGLGRVGRAALRHVADAAPDLAADRASRSTPATVAVPLVGRGASRASAASWSCPAPLGPRKPKISPARRSGRRRGRLRPSALRALKVRRRSVVSIIGPPGPWELFIICRLLLCPMLARRSLAPFSILGQYLRSADNHPHRSTCQHGPRHGVDGGRPGPSARELPGLDLRPVGRHPAGPVRVRHRRARAAHRHGRGDRRQARRGHGPHDRRGHARHRPPRAGRLRPAHHGPGRPPARRRRGRPREGRDPRIDDGLARAGRRGRGRPLLRPSSSPRSTTSSTRMADLTQAEADAPAHDARSRRRGARPVRAHGAARRARRPRG